jgi:hypothetical protein
MTHATNPDQVMANNLALFAADRSHQLTWSDLGHPELEGEPILSTFNGPVQVTQYPPHPGY